jgi:hypothetical protein
MKRFVTVTILVLAAAGASATAAEPVDGRVLLRICANAVRVLDQGSQAADDARDLAFCLGFVTAARQATEGEAERGRKFEDDGVRCQWHWDNGWVGEIDSVARNVFRQSCHPDELTSQQVARLAVSFMQAHPEELRAPAVEIVTAALRETFPCADDGRRSGP